MQNLVLLIDSSDKKSDISLKAGKMCLNRFCIDEEAAFELSGVNYLNIRSEINRNYAKKRKGIFNRTAYICLIFYRFHKTMANSD